MGASFHLAGGSTHGYDAIHDPANMLRKVEEVKEAARKAAADAMAAHDAKEAAEARARQKAAANADAKADSKEAARRQDTLAAKEKAAVQANTAAAAKESGEAATEAEAEAAEAQEKAKQRAIKMMNELKASDPLIQGLLDAQKEQRAAGII